MIVSLIISNVSSSVKAVPFLPSFILVGANSLSTLWNTGIRVYSRREDTHSQPRKVAGAFSNSPPHLIRCFENVFNWIGATPERAGGRERNSVFRGGELSPVDLSLQSIRELFAVLNFEIKQFRGPSNVWKMWNERRFCDLVVNMVSSGILLMELE
nr:hypothetical protein Iba_chr07bCG2240 [Ipomoea batatas]GMD15710.1 hypothetical protein Iba_chr07cCG2370 [Ipomoea batatas]GMD17310.1 hypothetical protein Iba_chr07dCG2360 [Ipomoea batatas]